MWSLRDLPQSKSIDVRQELVDFHDRHYRAPAMNLVVLGNHSLDELQEMVLSSFSEVAGEGKAGQKGVSSGIAAGTLPKESAAVAAAGLPFDSSALGKAFRIQPVKDMHRLSVTWQLGEQNRCVCWPHTILCFASLILDLMPNVLCRMWLGGASARATVGRSGGVEVKSSGGRFPIKPEVVRGFKRWLAVGYTPFLLARTISFNCHLAVVSFPNIEARRQSGGWSGHGFNINQYFTVRLRFLRLSHPSRIPYFLPHAMFASQDRFSEVPGLVSRSDRMPSISRLAYFEWFCAVRF